MNKTATPVRCDVLDLRSEAGRPSNEDAIGATSWAAWVIDGTKGPFEHELTPGPTDATWHAQMLNAVLRAQFSDLPDDPAAALSRAADQLSAAYGRNAVDAPPHEQPSACLALIVVDRSRTIHLFNIGDCRILVERSGIVRSFGSSGIERLETAAIAELVRIREVMGDEGDPWDHLTPILRSNFETAMNKPGGYWVVHPSLPWLPAVQHWELSARDVDHVLIASDGFFRLVNVFGMYDEKGLVEAALTGKSLSDLIAELRGQEADDIAGDRHPRLKSMDDASAVLVRMVT